MLWRDARPGEPDRTAHALSVALGLARRLRRRPGRAALDARRARRSLPTPRLPDAAPPTPASPPATSRRSRRSSGRTGGELTLCGARLSVAPGVLAAPVRFAIAAVDAPPPGPPRELAGPAFRFTADGGVELPAAPVDIAVPHGGRAGRIELFAVEEGELFGVEACTVDDRVIGQLVGLLGTFVATVDPYPYADSPGDLGSGTLPARSASASRRSSFPDDGYMIDQAWGDPIALSAVTDILDGTGGPEQLRFDATSAATRRPSSSPSGTRAASSGSWAPRRRRARPACSRSPRDGDRLVGTISATLFAGEDTIALTADLDLTPAYWTFPPERFCGGGKKPPG